MPELIQCPNCNRKLRVPDNLIGKKVKCPSCSTAFTAATGEEELPTAPLIDEDDNSESGRRKPSPKPAEEVQEKRPRQRPARPPVDDADDDDAETDEDDDDDRLPRRRRRLPVDDDDEEEVGRRRPRRRRSSRARSAVAGPAIALMVLGGLSLALYLVQLILIFAGVNVLGNPKQLGQNGQAYEMGRMVGGILGTIVALSWAGVVLTAGVQMKNLKGYGYAIAGSIIAMVPCNICCLLGIPFGIWSLVVLNKPEVKDAFR